MGKWQAELDELIRMGYADWPRGEKPLPADWRTRPGPDAAFSREKKQALSAGLSRGWHKRRPTRSFARLKDVAARMRAKYVTRRRISQKRNAEKRWENLASRKSLKRLGKRAL